MKKKTIITNRKTIIVERKSIEIEERLNGFKHSIDYDKNGLIKKLTVGNIEIIDSPTVSIVKGLKEQMNFEDLKLINDLILMIQEENEYYGNH